MLQVIAQLKAEPLMLMSLVKPVLMLAVLCAWAWIVGRLDKDAGYFFIRQKEWGMGHVGAGFLGFGVMLLVPIFWIGWPLGVLILVGDIFAYITFRNGQVNEKQKWSYADIIKRNQQKAEAKQREKYKELANVKNMDKS